MSLQAIVSKRDYKVQAGRMGLPSILDYKKVDNRYCKRQNDVKDHDLMNARFQDGYEIKHTSTRP